MNLINNISKAPHFITQVIRQNPKTAAISVALGLIGIVACYRYCQKKDSNFPAALPKTAEKEIAPKTVTTLTIDASRQPHNNIATTSPKSQNKPFEQLNTNLPPAVPKKAISLAIVLPLQRLEALKQILALRAAAPTNDFTDINHKKFIDEMLKAAKIAESMELLPTINIGNRADKPLELDHQGYINCLGSTELKGLGPVAYITDRHGRSGIAMHVQERQDHFTSRTEKTTAPKPSNSTHGHSGISMHFRGRREDHSILSPPSKFPATLPTLSRPLSKASGVFVAFQRYSNNLNDWRVSLNGSLQICMNEYCWQQHLQEKHPNATRVQEPCETCPQGVQSGDSVHWTTVAQLLTNTNPVFEVAPVE